jgi:hypothetical protein
MFNFLLVSAQVSVCDLWRDLHLIKINCCMNVKFMDKIVKGIEILILKGFNIVYVKSMVGKRCGILIIHKQ